VTGGGDLFETDSILGPFAVPTWGDSLSDVNEQLRREGLPPALCAIHIGYCVSAIDRPTQKFVTLDRTTLPRNGPIRFLRPLVYEIPYGRNMPPRTACDNVLRQALKDSRSTLAGRGGSLRSLSEPKTTANLPMGHER
jgi:hypothetical protein